MRSFSICGIELSIQICNKLGENDSMYTILLDSNKELESDNCRYFIID